LNLTLKISHLSPPRSLNLAYNVVAPT